MNKIFAIYKPKGPTSHDIVDQIRKITGERRVGHAGTLDPLAEGVLVIAVGREATKKLNVEMGKEKEYVAEIKLGVESTTDDEEGEKKEREVKNVPMLNAVEDVVKRYIGAIEQVPPIYSAIKVKGRPAYKAARKGQMVELKPRKVLIKSIAIENYEWPIIKLRVICGSGVYIRSLARDIGKDLGTGGYMASLIRTRVGEYFAEKLKTVDDLRKELTAEFVDSGSPHQCSSVNSELGTGQASPE